MTSWEIKINQKVFSWVMKKYLAAPRGSLRWEFWRGFVDGMSEARGVRNETSR